MAGGLKLFRSWTAAWRWMSTTALEAPVKKERDGTMPFRRLAAIGFGSSDAKAADVLDDWERQGHSLRRPQLIAFAGQLRRFKKPHIALQVYQWMDERNKTLNNSDRALCIDLLFKTEGITSAENYFNSLEQNAKSKKTYGALLNCYCRGQELEKAMDLFEKMTKLNFNTNALQYNNMMDLYMKVGQPEKVPLLFQEMEEKNITPDGYSYNLLMSSYGALNDMDAIEEVLEKMKSRRIQFGWFTYGNLAAIYLKAGLKDQAKAALKELEKQKIAKAPQAFDTLMNLYSLLSDPVGVARAWELCKSNFRKPVNTNYLIMHLALSRLGDYEGLEKLFKEWESVCSNYDIRIPNVLLESYLKREMIEEASLLYDSIGRRGICPNLRTDDALMKLCLKKRKIDLALQTLATGAGKVSSERHSWFPSDESVNAFLRYFEEEKDAAAASEFCVLMKMINRLDAETEKRLKEV